MKKRIVIVGDSPRIQTGYARIGKFIAKTLFDAGYDIYYLPCNADYEPKEGPITFPYTVYPFEPGDRYFGQRLFNILNQIQPSLVFAIGEFAYVGYVSALTKDMGMKSLYYMPVEGRNYPPAEGFQDGRPIDLLVRIAKFDYIVAYSEFGKKEISRLLPGVVTAVVPHQVDTKMFRPLDRNACRKIYIPEHVITKYGLDNIFVVGSVCRNQRRKGTDYIMKGFAKFLEREDQSKKVAILLMVTDQYDPQGYNLKNLVDLYNLKGRIIHYPNTGGIKGIPDNGLVELYNSMDVNLCPFRGEGWGLQILEGMACGTRTIATNYASPAEYGKEVLTYIPPYDYEPQLGTNCEWAVLRSQDIADKIYEHYAGLDDTKFPHVSSIERAQMYSEEAVAKQWVELINSFNLPEKQAGAPVEKAQTQDYQANVVDQYLDLIN